MADDSPREGPREPGKPKGGRAHAGGFTLDLSDGKPPGKRRRKSTAALVQKTIDLSSKPAVPPPPAESASPPPAPAPRAGRDRPRPAGGHSLADLLDPETLARLRGSE
jgi:hypothetical protein